MKSYADKGFLAESAQPFFHNLRMVLPGIPAGANLFLGELEFRKKCCAKPIENPRNAQHFTPTSQTQLHYKNPRVSMFETRGFS